MVAKSSEWNVPLWCASLDLAFDRMEYAALFDALLARGVDVGYLAILAKMYQRQQGRIRGGSSTFQIERGVKQGPEAVWISDDTLVTANHLPPTVCIVSGMTKCRASKFTVDKLQ